MSKLKSILIALMCLVMCLAFAACQWDTPADESTSETTSISETTDETTSETESDTTKESESETPSETTSETPSACEHEFVLQSEKAPDCTHAGEKTFKCSKCGEEKTEEGEAALGHLFGDWEVVNAETCTVDGEEARYCTRDNCDEMETKAIPAAHKYAKNAEESVAPTCEVIGKDVYECSVCHDKYDEVVPALGHEENTAIEGVIVEATCEEGGYTTLTCVRCGKTYNIDEVAALGHDYETESAYEATCDYAGYTVKKCSRCNKSYREITAAKLSHTFGDDGVCDTCGKSYLDANALIVSSDDNAAYAIKDDVYDYLIYAKDDSSYYTTVTIDKAIVDRLIANRYFKINFMFGNPDNCYRAIGYKLPGDENFRYVNCFQQEGFGDNTLFSLVIADENGADEAIVTEEGIVLTILYRYLGQNGVTVDAGEEAKYHGTLNNIALKIDYVQAAKPFDYEDKSTWVKSAFSIVYNETDARFEVTDGDPGKEQIENDITLTAGLLAAMKAQKYGSFKVTMKCKPNQLAILGMKTSAWAYGAPGADLAGAETVITEDMLTSGYTFRGLYADQAQRVGSADYDQADGFYFTIEFIKAFDPETDEVISSESDYVNNSGVYSFTGKDPRVTVLTRAIAYWLDNGYTSIDIIVSDKEGQRAGKNVKVNGADNGTNSATITVNVALTEDMRTNGISIILYWSDISSWAGGSAPDGLTLQIVAKN